MNTVGERLKILREGIGLSQKKMAELLDVTQPSINRYEHGKAVPLEVLIGYADYFDVSMDYIPPAAVPTSREGCIRHDRRSLTIRNWESLSKCALIRNPP